MANPILQMAVRESRRGRQKKRWEEWTGQEFGKSARAIEDIVGWGHIVETSCGAPTTSKIKELMMMIMSFIRISTDVGAHIVRIIELCREKTNVLHMQKQRCRSASSNHEADQHLCFRYLNSTIPLLPKIKPLAIHLQWLYSLVYVRPGQNPHCWFSHVAAQ